MNVGTFGLMGDGRCLQSVRKTMRRKKVEVSTGVRTRHLSNTERRVWMISAVVSYSTHPGLSFDPKIDNDDCELFFFLFSALSHKCPASTFKQATAVSFQSFLSKL
jgi:hypothetical protein